MHSHARTQDDDTTQAYTRARTQTHRHRYRQTRRNTQAHYRQTDRQTRKLTHTCTHTHAHTRTHTHTHAHTHARARRAAGDGGDEPAGRDRCIGDYSAEGRRVRETPAAAAFKARLRPDAKPGRGPRRYSRVDALTDSARKIGAVNTLIKRAVSKARHIGAGTAPTSAPGVSGPDSDARAGRAAAGRSVPECHHRRQHRRG
jgi:hypothetical protein